MADQRSFVTARIDQRLREIAHDNDRLRLQIAEAEARLSAIYRARLSGDTTAESAAVKVPDSTER